MSSLWQKNKLLVLGFLAALMLTSILLVRLIADVVYWPQHRDTEISSWMTLGYVAQSYEVDKNDLVDALSINADVRRHLTLQAIADAQGLSLEQIERTLLETITSQRANP
ncbi:MAG: hypothetical protein AAED33_11685 [Paracoccaceae bacterium]|jgi:hypothetical protein